jgi:signal transduction histidine kinase
VGYRRLSIRLRLTLLYGALFVATAALLLLITYVLTAHVLPLIGVQPPTPPNPPAPPGASPFGPPAPPPAVPDPPDPGAGTLGMARQRAEDLWLLVVASGFALAIMAFVALGLGWLMAGRMLRPMRTMAATAREMSAHDLHQRFHVDGPGDEIKDLADTFDGLLARLEASFQAQQQFVANASHELRTPLTFERSLIEVALADPDATAPELRATCERILANNEHQERLIDALLALARGQQGPDRRHELDIAEITRALLDTVRTDAAARGVHIEADLNAAPTSGDPKLVERLVTNVVDNAVRHNVPDGRVTVWTGVHAGRPGLRVTNTGRLIPPDQLGSLFQPFRRLGATRAADGGLGLGLSIVAAIAATHDAELTTAPLPDGGLDLRASFQPRTWTSPSAVRARAPWGRRAGGTTRRVK